MHEHEQDPAVSILEQIEDQSFDVNGGSNSVLGWLSQRLGNRGTYCTITKECQPACN